jgi:hypothetical protein
VVIFYLEEYPYFLRRLDSGGETSPKATFLATTLGPRRLLHLLEAISNPNLFFSFLKKILFEPEKLFLNSISYSKDKNHIFGESNFDAESVHFFGENPSTTGDFSAMEGRRAVMDMN